MSENPFDRFQAERHARHKALSDEAFENRTVEFVARTFGLQKQSQRLRHEHNRATGRNRSLTLLEFCRDQRSFPVIMTTRRLERLHLDKRMFLPSLFKKFSEAPFVGAYEEYYETVIGEADGRAVGLIFPRKGIPRGLIVHNGVNLPSRVFHGLVLTYTGGKKDTQRLFVQPFQSFIESLYNRGHGWQPS